jgi:hypothetical protein
MPFEPQRAAAAVSQGKMKRPDTMWVRFHETRGASFGRRMTDAMTDVVYDKVEPLQSRSAADAMDNAPALYSGIKELRPQGGHDQEGQYHHHPGGASAPDGAGHFRARRSLGVAGMMVLPMTEGLLRHAMQNERDQSHARSVFLEDAIQNGCCSRRAWPGRWWKMAKPLVGFGLIQIWTGRAEAWQLTSRQARPRHLVQAARIATEILDSHQRDPAFRRVEMFVHCHCSWALSFIAALGFEARLRMDKWDPRGRDVWLCERIREAA